MRKSRLRDAVQSEVGVWVLARGHAVTGRAARRGARGRAAPAERAALLQQRPCACAPPSQRRPAPGGVEQLLLARMRFRPHAAPPKPAAGGLRRVWRFRVGLGRTFEVVRSGSSVKFTAPAGKRFVRLERERVPRRRHRSLFRSALLFLHDIDDMCVTTRRNTCTSAKARYASRVRVRLRLRVRLN